MTHHRGGEINPPSWIGILKVFELHILNGGSGSIRVTRGDKTPKVTMSLVDSQDIISKPRKKKSPSKRRKNKIRLENWLKSKRSPPLASSDQANLECQLIDDSSVSLPHSGTGAAQGRGQHNYGPSRISKCPENEQCSDLVTGDDLTKDIEYRKESTDINHVRPAIPVDTPALCQGGEEGGGDPTRSDENQAETFKQQMLSIIEEGTKKTIEDIDEILMKQTNGFTKQLAETTLSFKNARKDS